ncbi:MAG: CCA tRNA nucleotidyltransferase [Bacilli bacterium]|nr:CCA tRNA nucleotidyltransferase [Bacilli bacterium]
MFDEIKKVLERLEQHNFEAYVVGGFIRDYLLERETNDVDICTNASCGELANIFPGSKANYLKSGIKFRIGDNVYEISTYRTESNYRKRTPQNINFINDVEQDLVRRDFTINALLMDKDLQIYDYHNSKIDLLNGIIRELADVTEDPLRILRAIRFATILDFKIEEELDKKIKENSSLVDELSNNRIMSEVEMIINSSNWQYGYNLLKRYNLIKLINQISDLNFH